MKKTATFVNKCYSLTMEESDLGVHFTIKAGNEWHSILLSTEQARDLANTILAQTGEG